MGSLQCKCQLHWSVLLLLIMTVCCTSARKCTQDEHLQNNKCVKCPVCPRGQGLSEECGYGHGINATCIPCVEGKTFSKDKNSAECTPCRQCSLYKREVQYQCRAVVDSQCGGCLPQFYENSWSLSSPRRPQPCEKCSSDKDHPRCASHLKHDPVKIQDSYDTTPNYQENQSGDQYKIATVLLGVMLALALIAIAFLVFLVAHISKWSSGGGVRPLHKGDYGRENRGESFTESLQEKNEDENLLLASRHFRGNVEDHQYEVVVENVKPPGNVVIPTQEFPPQHSPLDDTAPCSHDDITSSAHGPTASGNLVEEEPQSLGATQSQIVIVHTGEPQIAETTTAVPTFSSPTSQDANINEGILAVSQVPTWISDGDDGDNDRDSNCVSEASTLLVRNCDHGDAIHVEPCNIVSSGGTHGMNGLNNFDSEPNRPIFNVQPNISSRMGHGAIPTVSWKKNSSHASSPGEPPDLARPNLTIADLQEVGTTSPEIQQQTHDVASIQITINNTIAGGQPVLNNALVPPSLGPEMDVGQEDTETTAVKSVMNSSLFTRSCSMEERASNRYSVPVQESLMELKA